MNVSLQNIGYTNLKYNHIMFNIPIHSKMKKILRLNKNIMLYTIAEKIVLGWP